MNKKVCRIFAAGDFNGIFIRDPNDFVIAADKGLLHLEKLGVTPELIVGDFDCLGFVPSSENVLRFPAVKDYTDTALAVSEGKKLGYESFVIYGAIGGKRLEHTIANLQLAAGLANDGYEIFLSDGNTVVTAIHNSKLCFDSKQEGFISVFCVSGKACGVSLTGLKYELSDAVLTPFEPLGVSNEFIGKPSCIEVSDGTVLVLWNDSSGVFEN